MSEKIQLNIVLFYKTKNLVQFDQEKLLISALIPSGLCSLEMERKQIIPHLMDQCV